MGRGSATAHMSRPRGDHICPVPLLVAVGQRSGGRGSASQVPSAGDPHTKRLSAAEDRQPRIGPSATYDKDWLPGLADGQPAGHVPERLHRAQPLQSVNQTMRSSVVKGEGQLIRR